MAKVKVQLAQGNNRVIDIASIAEVQSLISAALAAFTPTSTTTSSGSAAPLTANPTAHVGLTPVNGSAFTAMRSDAAPELDQGISPTWTGTHAFSNMITVQGHNVVLVTRQVATDGTTLTGGGDLSADRTLSIVSTYAGQTSIVTVGTIATGTWAGTTIAIAHGGTGQTTANNALNALLPSQATFAGQFLQTDGTNTSWAAASGGSGGGYPEALGYAGI